ncbi:hypothetical protein [Flavobacterium sp. XS2P39]|uniref:hypothetical protein n=1 Tax=Flavobacterium sp. XS2P39 TaxID=3401725 RepID=UPI003AADC24A
MSDSFLVSYNRNGKLAYHDIKIQEDNTVNCIPIFEDLIFTAMFLSGKRILQPVDEQQNVFFQKFTQQERYLIASEFFDSSLINEQDLRKQNTEFCPQIVLPLPELYIAGDYNPVTGNVTMYNYIPSPIAEGSIVLLINDVQSNLFIPVYDTNNLGYVLNVGVFNEETVMTLKYVPLNIVATQTYTPPYTNFIMTADWLAQGFTDAMAFQNWLQNINPTATVSDWNLTGNLLKCNLANVTSMQLMGIGITQVINVDIPSLVNLRMDGCFIETFGDSLRNLFNLQVLGLNGNPITAQGWIDLEPWATIVTPSGSIYASQNGYAYPNYIDASQCKTILNGRSWQIYSA